MTWRPVFVANFVPNIAQTIAVLCKNMHKAGMSRINPGFLLVALVLFAFPLVWAAADRVARDEAQAALDLQAEQITRQHLQLIESELARFRLLPVVLADYVPGADGGTSDVMEIGTPANAGFNRRLAYLAGQTGASIIYAINQSGVTVAASNFDRQDSFVGSDFAFRPYFREAMQTTAAEYYGSGWLTGRPGLFFAHRVDAGAEGRAAGQMTAQAAAPVRGIVVVKYEFEDLLRRWQGDPGVALIIDPQGVVLSSTDPAALLTSVEPLTDAGRAAVQASAQFADHIPQSGPYRRNSDGSYSHKDEAMIAAALPISDTALTLVHLISPQSALRDAASRAWLLTLPGLLAVALVAGLIWWRLARAARAATDRRALESAVAERTRDLRNEMAERARADLEGQQAREALAQANRLASLGQITAGLAHEVNQPLATIRTLAENAGHHLQAGRVDRVQTSLTTTVDLTTRIGAITSQMLQFARKRQGDVSEQSLMRAIEGMRLILGDRLRRSGCVLDLPERDYPVMADPTRLVQVLVNLVQNALDAFDRQQGPRPGPRITLTSAQDGGFVTLSVADNGPGIPPDLRDTIFHPFVTGRAEGLGLGLAIAQDIMRDMGGDLILCPPGDASKGTTFLIRLRAV